MSYDTKLTAIIPDESRGLNIFVSYDEAGDLRIEDEDGDGLWVSGDKVSDLIEAIREVHGHHTEGF